MHLVDQKGTHFDAKIQEIHENKWFWHDYYGYNTGPQNVMKKVTNSGPSFGPPEMAFP